MAHENLLYELKDGIARITVNRPTVLNALNRRTMEELDASIGEAGRDESVRALVLTGSGDKAFVAGADINEVAGLAAASGKEFSLYGQAVFSRLENLGKPSIAAVNGYALGGGCELALAATLRIAGRTARFGLPEVKLGILPGYGGTRRLARLCGRGAACRMVLTGEAISAEEALRIGLVNQVVEPGELLSAAEALAKQIIANAPLAVKYALDAIGRGADMTQEEALRLEAELFGRLCASEDMREGTRAFLEKRPPQFKNR